MFDVTMTGNQPGFPKFDKRYWNQFYIVQGGGSNLDAPASIRAGSVAYSPSLKEAVPTTVHIR